MGSSLARSLAPPSSAGGSRASSAGAGSANGHSSQPADVFKHAFEKYTTTDVTATWKRVFDLIKVHPDQDVVITRRQFYDVFVSSLQPMDEAKARASGSHYFLSLPLELFSLFDRGSGRANLFSFFLMLMLWCEGDAGPKIDFCFDMFDVNDDNIIDKDELSAFVNVVANGLALLNCEDPPTPALLTKLVNTTMQAIDADNNGTIDRDEFRSWCMSTRHLRKLTTAIAAVGKPPMRRRPLIAARLPAYARRRRRWSVVGDAPDRKVLAEVVACGLQVREALSTVPAVKMPRRKRRAKAKSRYDVEDQKPAVNTPPKGLERRFHRRNSQPLAVCVAPVAYKVDALRVAPALGTELATLRLLNPRSLIQPRRRRGGRMATYASLSEGSSPATTARSGSEASPTGARTTSGAGRQVNYTPPSHKFGNLKLALPKDCEPMPAVRPPAGSPVPAVNLRKDAARLYGDPTPLTMSPIRTKPAVRFPSVASLPSPQRPPLALPALSPPSAGVSSALFADPSAMKVWHGQYPYLEMSGNTMSAAQAAAARPTSPITALGTMRPPSLQVPGGASPGGGAVFDPAAMSFTEAMSLPLPPVSPKRARVPQASMLSHAVYSPPNQHRHKRPGRLGLL